MYFSLPNITNPICNEELRKLIPPPSHNTVAVSNQITLFILSYISSRLLNLLKVTDAPVQVSDIFDRNVNFKFINFIFQCSFFVFLKLSEII